MTRTLRGASVAIALQMLAIPLVAQPAGNQSPTRNQSYAWLGQVVARDTVSKTVTVKVPYREHINRYIGEFKPGDKVKLTWATPSPGETEAITYVGRYDASSGKWGYVLPVEFVSADTTERWLTVTTTVPSKALDTLQTVAPGGWIKVTTPFDQPNETARIDRIEVAAEPKRPTA
jgi:hypothetical protein